MKYLLLPIHLLKFWYPEALTVFLRVWKNTLLFLEEDLAVGLMWKLLFTPLFHDSSLVGRLLSFFFRLGRILIGLFAFGLATWIVLVLALYWFLNPILVFGVHFINGFLPPIFNLVFYLLGVGLFLIHILTHPHKKVWQIRGESPWLSSLIDQKKVTIDNLYKFPQVKLLLNYLEIPDRLAGLEAGQSGEAIINSAFELAKKTGSPYIGPEHFFVAILSASENINSELAKLELTIDDFIGALNYLEERKNKWRMVNIWDAEFGVHHLKGINRGWLGIPTPNLDMVAVDLTRQAAKYGVDDFIGRGNVISEIVNILSQENGRNVVLVAPPGVGKTNLINYLAKKIVSGDAPPALATKRLVALDTTRLLAGISSQGDLAARVASIFEEVKASQNIIVVVEEIQDLGIGEAGVAFNLYSLLLPFIESSSFQFIATTEPENYTNVLEKQGAFARLFTKIELPPANEADTLQILIERAIDVERKNKIRVSFKALKKIIQLSNLIHDRLLPDAAINILQETETRSQNSWINVSVVEAVVSERTNVPTTEVGQVDKEKLLNLEDQIHQNLIDQVEAVQAVADSLRRSATGLREKNRPIGSFLFVGPTGVGKTELAKTLSEVYFKNSGAFLRFDMSEYQNEESVSRLIGGRGQTGELTEAVRNKPYCLLLLDEFEKAHPQILTLFLQVLDDGRLTDGTGKTVDFTNSIIITTSNVASLIVARGLEVGQALENLKKPVQEELLQTFKPELINRFDEIVLFKPLSQEDLEQVVKIKLAGLQAKLKEQGYLVEFLPQLVEELGKRGFDPVLGARPLRRLIQDTLESNLSKMILENKLEKGITFKAGVDLL